jgi:translocation and assembly module TamB
MSETLIDPPAPPPAERRGPLGAWAARIAKAAIVIALGLIALAAALMAFLDTGPGHRLIVDRIAALTPHSGLRIRIGRIDGSIWSRVQLRDVRVYDQHGLFAESPAIDMNWRPVDYLWGRLVIHSLDANLVRLRRLPKLIPSEQPGPILPNFDIHVGRLDIRQLRLDAPVTGEARVASLHGEAEIRRGRALVALDSRLADGDDRLQLRLDAEPDRDRFDLAAHVRAPAGGAIGGLIGTGRPIRLDVDGNGRWSRWRGSARLDVADRRAADLALTMDRGRFGLRGWAAPGLLVEGRLRQLAAPRVAVNASGTFADRRLDSRVSLRSAALRLETQGVADLGAGRFDGFAVAAELTRPQALFPNMTARQLRAALLLDGPFGTASYIYRITAPHLAFDTTGFDDFRVSGRGRLSSAPVAVSVLATARRVTGVGEVAGGILGNLRVEGTLMVSPDRIAADRLALTSDKLRATVALLLDLNSGGYAVALNGTLQRYLVPGLGVVDVEANLRVTPGPGGAVLAGHARAWVRRLDNGFIASLTGGLPRLESDIARGADGVIRFANLRLASPRLAVAGHGLMRRDGTVLLEGAGRHADYGRLALTLDGRLNRPRLALKLESPLPAAGLTNVTLNLEPSESGFTLVTDGGSMLGPFRGNGAILLPAGGAPTIDISALTISGTQMRGRLVLRGGGADGALDLTGGGLTGRLALAPVASGQRIAFDLAAQNAQFSGPPPIVIRRGTARGVAIVGSAGLSVEGQASLRGLSRGSFGLARLDVQASLRAGRGRVTARMMGTRAQDLRLDLAADASPGRLAITGNGTVEGQRIAITSPAVLVSTADGWRLERSRLSFAGGAASLSGLFGGERTELDAQLQAMPLTVLDLISPELGLGGQATGIVRYRSAARGALPSGELNLRVRGLTRSGLVLTSTPMDIGVNARLEGGNAALRAVMASGGRTVGRAQMRIANIGGPGDFIAQVSRAPMRAQIRYVGPADTLWRLSGIELLDLSGPVALGADITGSIDNPVINGLARARGARLESAVTGMVITNLDAAGRFDGSRLQLTRFQGTSDEGTVTGSGAFDFAAARGVGIDFTIRAENAQLLNRDDIRAAVTGDLAIRSDGEGGSITGSVRVTRGRFQLGAMSAAAQVPQLNVRERGPRDDEPVVVRRIQPWTLDVDVARPSRLTVTGLGMNSEWTVAMHVGGTVTAPAMRGEADLVRGTYDFAGRRFDLTRGKIIFGGKTPVNPQLDVVAEARIPGLNAQIHVGGTSQRPEITFTSIPAMPQDELLSRILFGTSITNLSAPEAIQLASAVAALNSSGGGLDPINALRRSVGLDRLRILPADVTQGIGTQIAAGKYLGRRVYVELVTDGQGYSATTVEYQITRWLSLLGTVSTIGRQSVNVRVSRDY